MKDVNVTIKGMSCASCVTRVEKIAKKFVGLEDVSVNLATEKLSFKISDPTFNLNDLYFRGCLSKNEL